MAEVTINGSVIYNVIGSRRQQLYNVTGTNGDTLTTGLRSIRQVNVQVTATNPPTGVTDSGGVVTFVSGGAFTTDVEVIGN